MTANIKSSAVPPASRAESNLPPHMPAADRSAREHFIPVRKADLVRLLADQALRPAERQQFLALCRMLEATFHFEYHQRLEELKDAYAWFDPDADTQPKTPLTLDQADRQVRLLFEKLTALLARANYVRVSHECIQAALDGVSDWGVNLVVDLKSFERVEVYARGEIVEHRFRRSMRSLYRQRQVAVGVYQRLVVAFRPKPRQQSVDGLSGDSLYIKIFKTIPKMDVEMLLPGTRVKMALVDRGRILLPALSGMAITLYKALTGALVLAVSGTYGLLTMLGLVGGTVGYGVKSFLSYLRAKEKYQLNLTRSLYYQNLDNNAGVLYRLLDEAEEQEFRETILAYHVLWNQPESKLSQSDLDERAEKFLRTVVGVEVDFEVDDALKKLTRLGLVEILPDGRLRAATVSDALCRLDRAWDNFFQFAAADAGAPQTLPTTAQLDLPRGARKFPDAEAA